MKIYLETKDKDNHRIVFVGRNGKLVYAGEWVRRKGDAYKVYARFVDEVADLVAIHGPGVHYLVEARPYKPGAFAKNSGPAKKKAVKSTSKRK